jgi:hypothetical protein
MMVLTTAQIGGNHLCDNFSAPCKDAAKKRHKQAWNAGARPIRILTNSCEKIYTLPRTSIWKGFWAAAYFEQTAYIRLGYLVILHHEKSAL